MNAQSHDGLRPHAWGQVFNLFRRHGSDLVCAVPVDRPVPPFLDRRWAFFCEADAACPVPGFDYAVVADRAGRNGFGFFRIGFEDGPGNDGAPRGGLVRGRLK